jgi:hypothetical protein
MAPASEPWIAARPDLIRQQRVLLTESQEPDVIVEAHVDMVLTA